MILRVPYEEFIVAVRETIGASRIYIWPTGDGLILSAAAPGGVSLILAETSKAADEVRAELGAAELSTSTGHWSFDESAELISLPYITGIAYMTGGERPGLWIDAAPRTRTSGEVLQALYDEFCESGELENHTFDEFIATAHPTVVELSPADLSAFVTRHTSA